MLKEELSVVPVKINVNDDNDYRWGIAMNGYLIARSAKEKLLFESRGEAQKYLDGLSPEVDIFGRDLKLLGSETPSEAMFNLMIPVPGNRVVSGWACKSTEMGLYAIRYGSIVAGPDFYGKDQAKLMTTVEVTAAKSPHPCLGMGDDMISMQPTPAFHYRVMCDVRCENSNARIRTTYVYPRFLEALDAMRKQTVHMNWIGLAQEINTYMDEFSGNDLTQEEKE